MATRQWLGAVRAAFCYVLLLAESLPRATRTILWVLRAALQYKRFQRKHRKQDPASAAYVAAFSEVHVRCAEQLVEVCRRNGGVYIKAGQFASAFGAVPLEYRRQLACLEDRATPRPYEQIRMVLLEELGPEAESIFSQFDRTATAAASLAQVHKACLVSGEAVAVKVQYPALAASVAADLAAIKLFSWLVGTAFPHYNMDWLVKELQAKLPLELNFMNEVSNARALAAVLRGRPCCVAPHMHEALSTPRVLIMEWVEGTKINDLEGLRAAGLCPRDVGWVLVKVFAELMLVHGYVHGDPHPGNLMVRRLGRRSFLQWLLRDGRLPFQLVLLDHGTYFTAGTVMREQLCQLWSSFVLADGELQADVSGLLAGARGANILPVLLTHSARTREEERGIQRQLGIGGFSDMSALLQTASRDLVELLRINTVVRAVSNQLGVTMEERKRVFAWFARRGLPPRSRRAPHIHRKFNQLRQRARLFCLVVGWHTAVLARACATSTFNYIVGLVHDLL